MSEIVAGKRLTAHKAVTGAEPCFAGLAGTASADAYGYPASLLLESWAQAALVLALWGEPRPGALDGRIAVAGAVRGVRLGAAAYPGDVIEHRVTLLRGRSDTMFLSGEAWVGQSAVLTVERFVAALRPADTLRPRSPREPS